MARIYIQRSAAFWSPLDISTAALAPLALALAASNSDNIKAPAATPAGTYNDATGVRVVQGLTAANSGITIMKSGSVQSFTPAEVSIAYGLSYTARNPSGLFVLSGLQYVADPVLGAVTTTQQNTRLLTAPDLIYGMRFTRAGRTAPDYYPASGKFLPLASAGYEVAGQQLISLSSIASIIPTVGNFDVNLQTLVTPEAGAKLDAKYLTSIAGMGFTASMAIHALNITYAFDVPDAWLTSTGATLTDYWVRFGSNISQLLTTFHNEFVGAETSLNPRPMASLSADGVSNTTSTCFFFDLAKLAAASTQRLNATSPGYTNANLIRQANSAGVLTYYGVQVAEEVVASISPITTGSLLSLNQTGSTTAGPHAFIP